MITAQFELFLLALGFYTRLPVPARSDYSRLPEASLYLPVVGWLVGGIMAAVFAALTGLLPTVAVVLLTLVVGLMLTGAFHEDGFADVCDGFGGGYGKSAILAIMKDSRLGTYGTLGLIFLMALKTSLISAMPPEIIPGVILASHSLSRLAPLLLMASLDYAREPAEGKAGAAVYKPALPGLSLATAASTLPFMLFPPLCVVTLFAVLLVTGWLRGYFKRHIGGYTGDCLGASQQVAEVIIYLWISIIWKFT